ncbi:MAG: hybrid sensor histidine kinase/response regulator [Candidatus Rokuibacteriota bacterium]|nr:MAG: hybrid sensor histidine kinase/response regulator [Candidatus Rokubacteria bacterium]
MPGRAYHSTPMRWLDAVLSRIGAPSRRTALSPDDLAALVDAAPLPIVVVDAAGVVRVWSAALEALLGWRADEVVGRPAPLPAGDRASELRAALERVLAGESVVLDVSATRRDGRPVELTVALAPLRAATPLAAAVVTERPAVNAHDDPVRLALEAGQLGVWEWDIAAGRVRWSPRLEAIHGLAPGTFRGTVEAFHADIHPDDRASVLAAIAQTLECRSDHRVEYRIVLPDGSVRWVEGRGQLVGDGAERRMLGVCLDVTERKGAERELDDRRREAEVVAELTRSISESLDLDTVLQRVCAAARELTGGDTATIALPEDVGSPMPDAMTVRSRVAPGAPEQPVRRIERGHGVGGRVMETGRPFRTDNYRTDPRFTKEYVEPAGEAGTVAALVVPIRIDGRVGGLLYVTNRTARPFSDRDETVLLSLADHAAVAIRNARLLATQQAALGEAERANRAKDEFLATLSHELRTPLTAMLGWVRMLRSGRLTGDQSQSALEVIERNTRLQAQLINDLLDVSRIVAGKLQLDLRPLELVSVVEEAVASVKSDADAKGLVIEASINPSAGPVLGDRLRLQQIVVNLLSNALKFTPADGRVSVVLERVGATARIQVSDTGIGIEPALLPHVFNRFLQADSTSSRKHGGLGLGLAIVRHLAELHGGSARAESAGPDLGATFTLELPILVVGSGRGERVAVEAAGTDTRLPRLEGLRVLVVDDHDDARELIRTVLQQCGADVAVAASADEALDTLDRLRVDVLVSDLAMPGADGYDLIRRIRGRERGTGGAVLPAVALTAYAGTVDRARALAAGFQAHASKPIAPDELATLVQSLTRSNAGGR